MSQWQGSESHQEIEHLLIVHKEYYSRYRYKAEMRISSIKERATTVLFMLYPIGGVSLEGVASLTFQALMPALVLPLKENENLGHDDYKDLLRKAVQRANSVLWEKARQCGMIGEWEGLAALLDVVVIVEQDVYLAHVGTGRVYHVPVRGGIKQLTADHNWIAELVAGGDMTPEVALLHQARTFVISRAVGLRDEIAVDTVHLSLAPGDILLLGDPALVKAISPDQLEKWIRCSADLSLACDAMMQEALRVVKDEEALIGAAIRMALRS